LSLSNKYYSHPGKSLCKHLRSVAESARFIVKSKVLNLNDFIEKETLEDVAFIIGASHDFGKFTRFFQEYLTAGEEEKLRLKNKKETHHGFISALFAYYAVNDYLNKLNKQESEYYKYLPVIAFVVVKKHHGNLIDFSDEVIIDGKDVEIFRKQISAINIDDVRKFYSNMLAEIDFSFLQNFADEKELTKNVLRPNSRKIRHLKREKNLFYYTLSLFLYSVLLDADKTDAAELSKFKATEIDSEKVDKFKEEQFGNKHTGINEIRENIYREVISQVNKIELTSERFFSINAPTGSGKTLTSFSFALKLRKRIENELGFRPRIIYSLPFLSIIEQNFSVIEEVLGFPPSNVLLKHHHLSETVYKTKENDDEFSYDYNKSQLLIEGWNSDVIVTTFAQFFHSVITNRNRAARKFHNIVNSIVIFDEIQALPHKYWLLFNELLEFIARNFNVFFVLMTATRPALFKNSRELLVNKNKYFSELSRYNLRIEIKGVDIWEFIEQVSLKIENDPDKTYLIVLNTVGSSIEVYLELKKRFEEITKLFYLSTNIIPKERIARIQRIKETPEKPKIIVSTQLIEAGVDIDADVVFRDLAPLDSINQTAGRCNRNSRKSIGNVLLVKIFTERENGRIYYPSEIYDGYLISKTEETLENIEKIAEEDFQSLTEKYFEIIDKTKSEEKSLEILLHAQKLSFDKLSEFKLIEKNFPSIDIFVEVDETASDLWEKYEAINEDGNLSHLEKKMKFLEIKREFYDYVISVPKKYAVENFEEGTINKISLDEVKQQIFYNTETGFKRENTSTGFLGF